MLDITSQHRERLRDASERLELAMTQALQEYETAVAEASIALAGAAKARMKALRGEDAKGQEEEHESDSKESL